MFSCGRCPSVEVRLYKGHGRDISSSPPSGGIVRGHKNDQLTVGWVAQLVRKLHRYRKGLWLNSHLILFFASPLQHLILQRNCAGLFLTDSYLCCFRRIGLANGIVTAGSGVGTVVMGPIMQLTVNHLGWANSTRVLAGMLCFCTIGSLLYRVPSQTDQKVEKGVEEKEKPKRPPMFDFSVFKNKAFLVWCIALSAFMMGYFVPFVHLVSDLCKQSLSYFSYRAKMIQNSREWRAE